MASEMAKRSALITDGRFSGATRGMCIGYVCPEAASDGPLVCCATAIRLRLTHVRGLLIVIDFGLERADGPAARHESQSSLDARRTARNMQLPSVQLIVERSPIAVLWNGNVDP